MELELWQYILLAVVGVVGVGSNWSAAARRVVAGLEQGRLLRLRRRRGLGVGEHN